jgi:putative ABC transport system substrate-binding protein
MTAFIGRREFITLLGGAAAGWPLAAHGQASAVPVIGFLGADWRITRAPFIPALRQGVAEAGYSDAQNVPIEFRWAEGAYDRLPSLAADLVHSPVAVIVAGDGPSARASRASTNTIPIVFITGTDPIESGLVTSLSRPAGNLTGVNMIAGPLPAKQLGLLRELIPAAKTLAILVNPNNANAQHDALLIEQAARILGTQVRTMAASGEADLDRIFETLAEEKVGGVVINTDIFFTGQRDRLVLLAAHYAIPAVYPWREYSTAGGLMSYGPSLSAVHHQVGLYVGKVLRGTKPTDLPVVQPTKFELIINLKTAKALGLTIPPGVLAIADEVIE